MRGRVPFTIPRACVARRLAHLGARPPCRLEARIFIALAMDDAVALASAPSSLPTLAPHTCCFVHSQPLLGMCEECGVPVCNACQTHIKHHNITTLATVAASEFSAPLNVFQVRRIAAAAWRHVRKKRAAEDNVLRKWRAATRRTEQYTENIAALRRKRASVVAKQKRAQCEQDGARGRAPGEPGRDSRTDTRRRASLERVLRGIDRMFKESGIGLGCESNIIARARLAAATLRGEIARLEFAASLTLFPRDTAGQASLALAARTCRTAPANGYQALGAIEFTALAGAHAQVEAAYIARLESRLARLTGPAHSDAVALLAASRACAAVFEGASRSDIRAPLRSDTEASAREAAGLLGVCLAPPGRLDKLENEDLANAVAFARANLTNVRGEAGEAQLVLDRTLGAWPPDPAGAGKDCADRVGTGSMLYKDLSELMGSARTDTAHEALAVAARSPIVNAEAESVIRAHAEAKHMAAVRLQADAVAQLQARADTFAIVAELEEMPTDEHTRRLVWTVLDEPCNPAPNVRAFNAFRGARTMPEVEAARVARLEWVGPIQVGTPVEAAWLPTLDIFDHPIVFLSMCGVLCVCGHPNARSLTVVHLPSKQVATVTGNTRTVYGFVYKDELFVAQEKHTSLWHVPIEDVFAGRTDIANFDQFTLVAPWGDAPSFNTAPRGFVETPNESNFSQLILVDLTARTSRLVNAGHRADCFEGFTGIDVPRASWATKASSSGPNKTVFAVAPDGAMRKIADVTYERLTALPSASRPTDLTRAAVFDEAACFTVGDAKEELAHLVQPNLHMLVRLHRDVFLCWDKNTSGWAAVRIVVP
eukprot:gnl/Chilomastix_cuspidata/5695.p1 GENE.gnl/Chilomastix_cuspidata/5695~~gnl/Chilomastix_cuspidata/5695.p1  ORF type:complete len:825 (+),score=78.09 gnl/Chilomastix_cuspidata/5695:1916-4390(+)